MSWRDELCEAEVEGGFSPPPLTAVLLHPADGHGAQRGGPGAACQTGQTVLLIDPYLARKLTR